MIRSYWTYECDAIMINKKGVLLKVIVKWDVYIRLSKIK